MNNPSFIIPPRSPLHRITPIKRSQLAWTLFVVLIAHVVILGGLLLQGCYRDAISRASSLGKASVLKETPGDLGSSEMVALKATALEGAAETPLMADALAMTNAMTEYHPDAEKSGFNNQGRAQGVTIPSRTLALAPGASNDATEAAIYVVAAGDTLTKIAKAHRTTSRAIYMASALRSDHLSIGQKLKIPSPNSASAARIDRQGDF
jgi:hypothetical protein